MSKSTRPTVRIHNQETDEVIDREMNDQELAKYNADQTANAIAKSEAEAKITAKAALLKKLGITEAEAELLLA